MGRFVCDKKVSHPDQASDMLGSASNAKKSGAGENKEICHLRDCLGIGIGKGESFSIDSEQEKIFRTRRWFSSRKDEKKEGKSELLKSASCKKGEKCCKCVSSFASRTVNNRNPWT